MFFIFHLNVEILGSGGCTDFPKFKDKYGTTCTEAGKFGNCKDGGPGKYSAETLKNDANNQGVSVLDACCVCGGGIEGI